MEHPSPDPTGRIVFGVFGFIFFAVGLSVLGFLWGSPINRVGSPPLFFRVAGSLIALAPVVMGAATLLAAIRGKSPHAALHRKLRATMRQAAPGKSTYKCPHCAAPLGGDAEVSPKGDVKCSFCDAWFNVYGR